MSSKFSILFLSLLLFASGVFASPEQLVCRGETPLTAGFSVGVVLSFSNLKEGEAIRLWSPITSDAEVTIQISIQKVIKTNDGVRILATYDRSNFTGLMTFELQQRADGSTVLADFKGFEGSDSFGPSELNCENDVN